MDNIIGKNTDNIGELQEKTSWIDFVDMQYNDENLNLVINLLTDADNFKNEKGKKALEEAKKISKKIDRKKYENEIKTINNRIKILQKRFDRQISEAFGVLLKYLREKKGYSLAKLGEITDISPSYINRIELGDRKAPSYKIIEKLANSLDVHVTELLEVAGLEQDESKKNIVSISKLIYLNNISFFDGEPEMSKDEKEKIVEIIEFIIGAKWKSNKHLEMVNLLNLIDNFKELKKS